MSNPPTLQAIPSAISLPGSAAGVTPSDSPDGPMTDLFGRAVVPVSPLVVRESLGGGVIRAIFGQRGISSSASAALQSSLVSRLRQRLDTDGSILFAMTWSEKATPSGRSVCLLRASAHRTADNGYGSWATPTTRDHKDGNATSCQHVPINCLLGRQIHLSGSSAETASSDQLNPAFSLWLMGYPTAWGSCAGRVMPLSRKLRQRSSTLILE